MGIVLALYISAFIGLIVLGFYIYGSLVGAILFSFDKVLVFIVTFYFVHQYFSIKVAEGNAVYFWNALISGILVILYSFLFRAIHSRFLILGKIINFAISYLGVLAAIYFVVDTFVSKNHSHLLPLLKNEYANKIINYVLLLIPAFFVWLKREERLSFIGHRD